MNALRMAFDEVKLLSRPASKGQGECVYVNRMNERNAIQQTGVGA